MVNLDDVLESKNSKFQDQELHENRSNKIMTNRTRRNHAQKDSREPRPGSGFPENESERDDPADEAVHQQLGHHDQLLFQPWDG